LAIVAVATNKSKRNFNLWKKQSTDLILRERLKNYISKSDYSFSFFRTAMYFFVAGLSTRNLLKIENSNSNVLSSAFVILILGIVNFFKQQDDYWKWKTHWRL
jgi:putative membrane protein